MTKFGYRIAALVLTILLSGCFPVPDTLNKDINWNGEKKDVNELLDEFTNSHQDYGCAMTLLLDGTPSYNAFRDLINSAKDHINIETLNFDDDEEREQNMAMEFIQMLIDKVKAGVEVNIIVDPFAQIFYSRHDMVDLLIEGGVNVELYMPPDTKGFDELSYRTHKKMMIVDGTRAIIGGMNFGLRYLGHEQWRDTNVLLTGPVVAAIQEEFLRDWEMLGRNVSLKPNFFPELEPTGEIAIRDIDQRPAEDDFDINTVVMIALRIAKKSVYIEAPYFNPTDWLIEELTDAANRGVEINILTNSQTSNDIPISYEVTAYWFQAMSDAGIKISIWNLDDRTMHSKVMLVDDTLAMVGSYNFNYRSIVWDTENAVIVTDPDSIEIVKEMILNDFNCNCVFEIDSDWINSQPEEELSSWQFWYLFHEFF